MFFDDNERRKQRQEKNINAAIKPMMAVCALVAAVAFFFPIVAIYYLSKEIIRTFKELFPKTIKHSLFINSLFIIGIFALFTGVHYIDKIIKFHNEEIIEKPSIFFSYFIVEEFGIKQWFILGCIALLVAFIVAFIFLWRFSNKWGKLPKYLTRSIMVLLGCFIIPILGLSIFT